MYHIECEPQGLLLQHQKPGVLNVCQGLVIEEAEQGFVIHSYSQLVTAEDKMSALVEGVSDS